MLFVVELKPGNVEFLISSVVKVESIVVSELTVEVVENVVFINGVSMVVGSWSVVVVELGEVVDIDVFGEVGLLVNDTVVVLVMVVIGGVV
jgi:hypothetical protein